MWWNASSADLEAGIIADTKGQLSDVRIPAIQKACEVGGVRVIRTPAYVGIAPGDEAIFVELKQLFPILMGWVPAPAGTKRDDEGGLELSSLGQKRRGKV